MLDLKHVLVAQMAGPRHELDQTVLHWRTQNQPLQLATITLGEQENPVLHAPNHLHLQGQHRSLQEKLQRLLDIVACREWQVLVLTGSDNLVSPKYWPLVQAMDPSRPEMMSFRWILICDPREPHFQPFRSPVPHGAYRAITRIALERARFQFHFQNDALDQTMEERLVQANPDLRRTIITTPYEPRGLWVADIKVPTSLNPLGLFPKSTSAAPPEPEIPWQAGLKYWSEQ